MNGLRYYVSFPSSLAPCGNKRQTVTGIIVFLFLLVALSVPLFIPVLSYRTIYPYDTTWASVSKDGMPGEGV